MGWEMPWHHHHGRLDKDFGVDEWHGTNSFIRDGDNVLHLFINERGDEQMETPGTYLDITALGARRSGRTRPRVPADSALRVVDLARRTDTKDDRTRPGATPRRREHETEQSKG